MKNELKSKLHNTIMESLLYLSDRRTKKYSDETGYFNRLIQEIYNRTDTSIYNIVYNSLIGYHLNNSHKLENIMIKEYVQSIAHFLHQERAS